MPKILPWNSPLFTNKCIEKQGLSTTHFITRRVRMSLSTLSRIAHSWRFEREKVKKRQRRVPWVKRSSSSRDSSHSISRDWSNSFKDSSNSSRDISNSLRVEYRSYSSYLFTFVGNVNNPLILTYVFPSKIGTIRT